MDKRRFYAQPHTSKAYDQLRFGGAAGEWVNHRELAIVRQLLPHFGTVLDLGCGTGRLAVYLSGLGYRTVGIDSSIEMLTVATEKSGADKVFWVLGDLFALPIAQNSFDAVVMLRVAFHFADLGQLLGQAALVLRPKGRIVFDTYRWSPRALAPLGEQNWGGRIYIHRARAVTECARDHGFAVIGRVNCFLFSPYVYRLLPMPVVRVLEAVERVAPDWSKARAFWCLRLL